MISTSIVKEYCLLLFSILALLECVSCYVAQLPNTVAEPVQILSVATPNNSLAINFNGYVWLFHKLHGSIVLNEIASAAMDLSQEKPPADFRVEFLWKTHPSSFGRLDFLYSMILDMATMATRPWNGNVPNYKFPTPYRVAIGFVSKRAGPGLSNKHIMWALERIFDIFVGSDTYLSCNIIIDLGPIALGVGNVYALPRTAPVDPLAGPVGDISNTTDGGAILSSTLAPSNDTVLKTDTTLPTYWEGNSSSAQTTLLVSQLSEDAVHLNASGEVEVTYKYLDNGAIFDDAQVYNATLKLLIQAAEAAESSDIKATVWPGLSTYNNKDDLTFTIRPVSFEARDELSVLDCIFTLSSIPNSMSKSGGPPGRFAELVGIVMVGGTITGRFCIEQGDKSGLNLENLCNDVDQESGGNGGEVATA